MRSDRLVARLGVAVLAVCLPIGAMAQAPARSEIRGTVVDESGAPMPFVEVGLSRVGAFGDFLVVTTDDDGRFQSGPLEEGIYYASVQATGFVGADAEAERHVRPGDTPTLRIARGGVITGKVTEAGGEPVVAMEVTAVRVRDAEGNPVTDRGTFQDGETDDRGVYRIYGLQAGAYIVSAGRERNPWSQPTFDDKLARIYYPSSTAESATEVPVSLGAEATNIDIAFRRVAGHTVTGTVSGSDRDAYVQMSHAKTGQVVGWARTQRGQRGVEFEFAGVADGEYDLEAQSWDRDARSSSAPRRVTVRGADVAGVALQIAKLGRLEGRIVWEQGPPPEPCPKEGVPRERATLVELRREAKAGAVQTIERGATKAGGAFAVANLKAGSYRLDLGLVDPHWYVAAAEREREGRAPASVAGQPVGIADGEVATGYVVRLRAGAAALAGRVAAPEGTALPSGLVVHLVPAEQASANEVLRYYEAEVERDGAFSFANLAPGEYRAVVRPREPSPRPIAWDPAKRTALRREAASGHLVALAPCERVTSLVLATRASQ
jgi:hypothetical protein